LNALIFWTQAQYDSVWLSNTQESSTLATRFSDVTITPISAENLYVKFM
jgi:hypothetical protein